MCSYFTVGNKIFRFFKNWVFAFLDEATFQGGVKFSKILTGVAHKEAGVGGGGGGGGGAQRDLELFGET